MNCTQQITFHLYYKHFRVIRKVIKCCPVGEQNRRTCWEQCWSQSFDPYALENYLFFFKITATTSESIALFVLLEQTSNLITDSYICRVSPDKPRYEQIHSIISNSLIFSIVKEAHVSYLLEGFWFPACPCSSCFNPASKASLEQCLSCLGKRERQ